MRETELAIIGAGAAGLAAASEAAEHGVKVTVLDDNAQPGGQYFRQLPRTYRRTAPTGWDKEQARWNRLIGLARQPGVIHMTDAVVWEAPEDGVLAFARGQESGRLKARQILVAAGAHDRPVPFPGWTLPGVLTAGGFQNLIKGQRAMPGRRVAVAANGPLGLLVASNVVKAGAQLVALAESAPVPKRLCGELVNLAFAPKIVRQAIDYGWTLARSRAPTLYGWTAIAARGARELEEVVMAPIGADGVIDHAKARSFAADTLVLGFGLTPSVELLRAMGCRLEWNALRGGWLPVRDAELATSKPGVLAAGDGSGIGGVEMALLEGKLAGLVAAERVGRLDGARARAAKRAVQAKIARLARFRAALERLYAAPATWLNLLTPETIVCRCEEVTAGELEARAEEGFDSTFALKGTTRVSMGRCQGRNCLRTLQALVARDTGAALEDIAMPRARPPARLVTIGDILSEELPAIELPKDPHLPRGEQVN
jgi:NADPH-dependent 2,4-dienoyl-CoA reductase/sulfur reductase-like enzyme